jgi:hypothetical protein
MTVTPLMVRVVFLLRMRRSLLAWVGVKSAIMSAFDGTLSKWYFAAVLIFKRLTSS